MPSPDVALGDATHRVFNPRPQPVELHLENEVVVVPALGTAELHLGDEPPSQVAALADRMLVDVESIEHASAEQRKPSKPRTGAARRTTRKKSEGS